MSHKPKLVLFTRLIQHLNLPNVPAIVTQAIVSRGVSSTNYAQANQLLFWAT